MYNQTPEIDFLRLGVILAIDTIIAFLIAIYQHREYGYKIGPQFIKSWFGITVLSFMMLKFF